MNMKLWFRKHKAMAEENLVIFNANRIASMMRRLEEDHEWDMLHDYDSIMSAADFIKREMERKYNTKAHLLCPYCEETIDGWGASSRLSEHELANHPEEVSIFNAVVAGAIVSIVSKSLEKLVSEGTEG